MDEMDSDNDAIKELRHAKGKCMDCNGHLRGNYYRCPSCTRRVQDIEEHEIVFSGKAVQVR